MKTLSNFILLACVVAHSLCGPEGKQDVDFTLANGKIAIDNIEPRRLALNGFSTEVPQQPLASSPFFPQQIAPEFKEDPESIEDDISSHFKPIDPEDLAPSNLLNQDLQDTNNMLMEGNSLKLTDIYNDLLETILETNCDSSDALQNSQNFSRDKKFDLCSNNIGNDVFSPLGKTDSTFAKVFDHLRTNIYRPLGYKISPYRFTYSDTIHDLLNLDENDQTIHKDMVMPSPSDFQDQIVKTVKNLQLASSNFDSNKEMVASEILNVLKDLHIFWNYQRQKNQINVTKSSTLSIIKQLIQEYKESSNAAQANTVNILENVKLAFYRFIKAHKMREYFRQHPAETVARHMVNRYKTYVEDIKENKTNSFTLVQEMAVFLDLLRAFQIINYKQGKSPSESLGRYEDLIANEITNVYNVQWKYMIETNDPQAINLTDFTAIILLKMRQRNHIIFNKYRIENFVLMPSTALQGKFSQTAKLYYQLVDVLMLIPNDCNELNGAELKGCVSDKFEIHMLKMNEDFMMDTSIPGVNLYDFIQNSLDGIIDTIDQKNLFKDFMLFRNEYFVQLFGFFEKFRQSYQIKDMRAVDELENEIGFQIEKSKTGEQISAKDFEFLDQLDNNLYSFFIDIKSDFNKFAPVTRDVLAMKGIADRLQKMVVDYYQTVKSNTDERFKNLLLSIVREGKLWVKKHSVKYVVNSNPSNYEPDLLKVITINDNEPDTSAEYLNQPLLNANQMAPIATNTANMLSDGSSLGFDAGDRALSSGRKRVERNQLKR